MSQHAAAGRRRFLHGLLLAALAPRAGWAQPPASPRVGVLSSSAAAEMSASLGAFRQTLERLGWTAGSNLALDIRYAGGRYDRLPSLAAELIALKPDVLFAQATPAAVAVKRATTRIPIVFESLSDAVATGLVANLARPGGNVTGVSGFSPELTGKRVELVRELLPGATRIALLVNRGNPADLPVIAATEAGAERLRVQIHVVDVRAAADLDRAFDSIVRLRSEAVIVVADPLLFTLRDRLIQLAARHRLPDVYEIARFPEAGAFMSYGPHQFERYERAAVYVDRILRGARPGELPVEQPSTFELVLNLKTARALRLEIPAMLRLRADRVIE